MSPGLFKRTRKDPAGSPSPEDGLFPAMPSRANAVRPPKVVARPAVTPEENGPAPEELGIPGRSALFLGPASDEPWRLFRMLSGGRPALVLSGSHPARLRLRFGLDEAALVWISAYAGSKEETLAPQTLEYEMLGRVNRHFRAGKGAMVLLDDLDYLSSQCGFGPLVRFVKSVSDSASGLRATFLASAEPGAFSDRERAALMSVFDTVHPVAGPKAPGRLPGTIPKGHPSVLIRGAGDAAYGLMEAGARNRRTLFLTPRPPRRIKEAFDFSRSEFLWLSESATGGGILRPQGYAVEGLRAVLRHLKAGPGALVLLDGLDGLRPYGDAARLVRFAKGVVDAAAECGGSVIASAAPGALEPAAEASLRRRFEAVLG